MKLNDSSRKYFPCSCGGDNQRPDTIVLHSTEGPTAAGAAAYLKNRPDGSAHVVVDNHDTFVCQVPTKTTCGAGGFNSDVYHIEQAGYAAWSRGRWVRNILTVRRAAYRAARISARYNVPLRWLSPEDIRRGRKGITTHANVTASGVATTTHTDPGKHYPRRTFMALARRYRRRS